MRDLFEIPCKSGDKELFRIVKDRSFPYLYLTFKIIPKPCP
jgi:hypothetical protein